MPQLANEYAKKCNWRPGLAINWFNEPNLFQEQQNKEAVFKKLIQEADQANRSAFILNQDDYSTEGIRENISFLAASLAEIIRQGNWPINKILKIGESLRWGKTLLRQNVTPQVIWEYLIMSL
ncbi:MAG: hypothetical protein NTV81_01395 [Candidatus Komeilibacteria bacterium]|nr:hypothetical protein [Candidatus Komeilibacteria bacterium]